MEAIVVDTSVWMAALYSRRGASFRLLSLLDQGLFEIHLSVALVFEYEASAKRARDELGLDDDVIDELLDYICEIGVAHEIYYLWRPYLADPDDDMVLELAVSAGCKIIVTFNLSDFRGCERFGIQVMTPQEFLRRIGAAK